MRVSPELEQMILAMATSARTASGVLMPAAGAQVVPPAEDCSEKEFQAEAVQLAIALGWSHYHTHNSRRSPEGFPDEVFARGFGRLRLFVAEFKIYPNKPTEAQAKWLKLFEGAGVPAYVWYPDQWEETVAVLRSE